MSGKTEKAALEQRIYDRCLVRVGQLEAENAKLREYITRLEQANIVLSSDNCDLLNDMSDMQFFIAENAKLLKELEAEHALAETLGHYHELEQAENAKLRELASVLRRCLGGCLNGEDCDDGCPMLDADGWCNRDNRLREFGIEVEDQ